MVSTGRAEGFSPELRASFFHFTVFASTAAGMTPAGAAAVWLSLAMQPAHGRAEVKAHG
jgi:hypothetical protein